MHSLARAIHSKHNVTVLAIQATWWLLLAGIVQATPIVDQQHAPSGSFPAITVANDRTQIQAFTVGITGVLTRIDIQIERATQDQIHESPGTLFVGDTAIEADEAMRCSSTSEARTRAPSRRAQHPPARPVWALLASVILPPIWPRRTTRMVLGLP
jgi:hypothetical protein